MKIKIEFELDVSDDDKLYDLIADYTYEIRSSRYLVPGSWGIIYDSDGI